MEQLTTVDTVHEEGSWLFTVSDRFGDEEEVILVPCENEVEAWVNRCTHESQRFDTGRGAPIRNGQIVCPRHGSMFDSCSGHCDNGEAADTTLPAVDITVHTDGTVFLTDDDVTFAHEGGIDDDDDPDSTSHISL